MASNSNAVLQRTDYFPFGLAHSTSPVELAKNKYLYNGKEWQTELGYGVLDYGARLYDPKIIQWNRIDRFSEKYFNFSPYSYTANNPILNIDINGDSIAVLNMGYGANQHLALLIQNKEGKWQYFSVNGNNVYVSGSFSGGRKFNDIAVGEFNSPQEFLQSSYNSKGDSDDKNINKYGFQEAYILPTDESQDNTIKESFIDISKEEYRLSPSNPNQCATAVQKSLNRAGIETTTLTFIKDGFSTGAGYFTKSNPYLPSSAFNAIINSNPNGQLIKKHK